MKRTTMNFIFISVALIIIGVGLYLVISASNAKGKPTKTCTLVFDKGIVLHDVPLAETIEQREKGLSGKNSTESSMLFSLPEPMQVDFWMRDTKIPLDIGFISVDGILFKIEEMQPETETRHHSGMPASDVLELAKGQFAKLGLHVGSKLMYRMCKPIPH